MGGQNRLVQHRQRAAIGGMKMHDSADILSNVAQPTNLTNLSQGLAYNTYFFGAVENIAVQGLAKPTTSGASAPGCGGGWVLFGPL